MTTGNYGDMFNETKLPAVTGKPMRARPGKKKKKRPKSQPMHARLAAAMEKC